MIRNSEQRGYILLPVVILLTLVASAAFMLNYESALDSGITASNLEVKQAELVARAGLEHATWTAQNSGCIGDMAMTTVPFGPGNYNATVDSTATSTSITTLNPDRDSFIRENNPDTNFGTDIGVFVGTQRRGLIHFDLSSIAAGSRVVSATLWLYVTNNDPGDVVNIHPVTASWTEAGATWNTMASSFDAQKFGVIAPQPTNNVWVPVNLTAMAQSWVNDAAANHGLMLISESITYSRYSSRDHGTTAQHPYLQVTTANGSVSPIQISVTGTLAGNPSPANDISRKLERTAVPAYQPPGYSLLQLQPGSGKDAMLSYWYDTKNYGNYRLRVTSSASSPRNSLVQFDLATVPFGARVISAQLQLYHTITETPGADAGVTVHRVSRDWIEGTQSGTATADGANWLTWDGTNAWATAGGDYDTAPVANSPITDVTGEWESWDVTMLAQGWLDGSFANNGLLLKGTGTVAVAFASKEDIDPTLHPKLNISYACECGSPCLAPQGSGTVLMVVVNPTTLVPADAAKKTLFESWGYTVSIISESANQASYDAAMATADVVFISETVNASQVGTRLAGASIGVVNQDGSYNNALGFASGSSHTVASAVNLTDTSHFITTVFPFGPLEIYASAMEQLTVSGSEAPGLQTLADTGGVGSLVALDTGAMGTGGTPLAGRRVMLPFGRDFNMNWPRLNNNGLLMLHRALRWGMGDSLAVAACEADFTPDHEVSQFSTSSYGSNDPQGITYFAEGLVFNGVTSPAGGAWISIDDADRILYLTDMTGSLLTSVGISLTGSSGVTLVTSGTFANHLAVSDLNTTTVSYFTLDGTSAGNILTSAFGVTTPSGVAFIETSASASYDGRLAIASNAENTVSIVTQSGVLETSFTVAGPLGDKVTDIAHLPVTDKVMVSFDTVVQIYDFAGTLLREYSTSGFGADKTRAVAIQPLSCQHVIVDKDLAEVQYLDQGAPPLSVLLVVGDAATLDSKDAGRKALMETWGYVVSVIDDSDSQASFDAASAAADVVYVSGTVVDATLLDKLTGSTTGIVNELPGKLDNFGFSSSTASTVNADGFSQSDAAHYITEPFSGNPVTVFSATLAMPVPAGTLAPDLHNVAEVSATAALVTLGAGATRYDSSPAAARRAQLPFSGAETSELTGDGETMLQRALEWAAGAGGSGGPAGLVFEEFTDAKANAATNLSIDKPPATVAGDLLIAVLVTDGSTSGSMSPPAGWNPIDLDETSGRVTFGVWWKLATASESASYTFSWSGGEKVYGMIMRFSGHDPVNPIHVSATNGGTSTTPSSPAVTTTVADTMILRLGGFDDDDITVGDPGLAGHTAITMDKSGNGSGTSSAGAGYRMQAVAGDSGTSSFTLTNTEEYRSVTIAIAPAP